MNKLRSISIALLITFTITFTITTYGQNKGEYTVIINYTNAKMCNSVISSGLSVLNIYPDTIRIRLINSEIHNKHYMAYVTRQDSTGNYNIFINELRVKNLRLLKTLAHELYHIKQMYHGDLIVDRSGDKFNVRFRNKYYTDEMIISMFNKHNDRPWEREAEYYSSELSVLIIEEMLNSFK